MFSASALTCSSIPSSFLNFPKFLYRFFTGGWGMRRFMKCFLTKVPIPLGLLINYFAAAFLAASSSSCSLVSSSDYTYSFVAISSCDLSLSAVLGADSSS